MEIDLCGEPENSRVKKVSYGAQKEKSWCNLVAIITSELELLFITCIHSRLCFFFASQQAAKELILIVRVYLIWHCFALNKSLRFMAIHFIVLASLSESCKQWLTFSFIKVVLDLSERKPARWYRLTKDFYDLNACLKQLVKASTHKDSAFLTVHSAAFDDDDIAKKSH